MLYGYLERGRFLGLLDFHPLASWPSYFNLVATWLMLSIGLQPTSTIISSTDVVDSIQMAFFWIRTNLFILIYANVSQKGSLLFCLTAVKSFFLMVFVVLFLCIVFISIMNDLLFTLVESNGVDEPIGQIQYTNNINKILSRNPKPFPRLVDVCFKNVLLVQFPSLGRSLRQILCWQKLFGPVVNQDYLL